MTTIDPADETDDDTEPDEPHRSVPLAPLIAFIVAVALLGGVVGWRIGAADDDPPAHESVDVGFFQDMSAHHNQAVAMSLAYLEHGSDPLLRQIAREILLYQSSEIGVMSEYLNTWRENGTEGEQAMAWMGMPTPRNQMTGLASDEQMQELVDARGRELDDLFTALMIRHHEGGIHMADYAAEHAGTETVRDWAFGMADAQRGEIAELNRWRVQHDLPVVEVPLA